jgi:hypothetical protein
MSDAHPFDPGTLLPADFDAQVRAAVRGFWSRRGTDTTDAQPGNRGAVVGGKNLDGFIDLVKSVTEHVGLPARCVIASGRASLSLPGYFRPTKNWDVLVKVDHHLLGVFEFKSHVGPSFGNNANNRAEEAMGSGIDLRAAIHHGALVRHDTDPHPQAPPFVAYLMLLEDSQASRRPVRVDSPNFPPFPDFEQSSYAMRYRVLCERLVSEQLYTSAALMFSPADAGSRLGDWSDLSADTAVRALFARYAAHAAAFRLARGI